MQWLEIAQKGALEPLLGLNNAVKSGVYVIVAKNGVNDLNFAKFENNLKWSFKKIDALK